MTRANHDYRKQARRIGALERMQAQFERKTINADGTNIVKGVEKIFSEKKLLSAINHLEKIIAANKG